MNSFHLLCWVLLVSPLMAGQDRHALPAGAILRIGRTTHRAYLEAMSPDGNHLVWTSNPRTYVSRIDDGQVLFSIPDYAGDMTMGLTPGGRWLIVGYRPGHLQVYSAAQQEAHQRIEPFKAYSDELTTLLVSRRGDSCWVVRRSGELITYAIDQEKGLLAEKARSPAPAGLENIQEMEGELLGRLENSLVVFDLSSGKYRTIDTQARTIGCVVSPDGKEIALVGEVKDSLGVWVHEKVSGRVLRDPASGRGYSLVPAAKLRDRERWGPLLLHDRKGRLLRLVMIKDLLRIWIVTEGTELWRVEPPRFLPGFRPTLLHPSFVQPGTGRLISSTRTNIGILDAETGTGQGLLPGHDGDLVSVSFSPDGRHVGSLSEDGTLRLFDAADGRETERFPVPGYVGRGSLAFHPEGRFLAGTGSFLHVWDLETGEELPSFHGKSGGGAVTFLPDGKSLFLGGSQPVLHEFPGGTSREPPGSGEDPMRAMYDHRHALSPDGKILAVSQFSTMSSSSKGVVQLFPWDHPDQVRPLQGLTVAVQSLAFARGGTFLVTGADDGQVLLWDVAQASRLHEFEAARGAAVTAVAVDPAGEKMAIGWADGEIRIYDVNARSRIPWISVPSSREGAIRGLALSPDGKRLASIGRDPWILIWSLEAASGQ